MEAQSLGAGDYGRVARVVVRRGRRRLAPLVARALVSVSVSRAALRGTHWQQYALRFVLGGAVTAATGIIATMFGPVIGGFFLAFPVIFAAGATLIATRERNKKTRAGMDGTRRGSRAAALDAAGTMAGAVGLMCFAALLWKELVAYGAAAIFGGVLL